VRKNNREVRVELVGRRSGKYCVPTTVQVKGDEKGIKNMAIDSRHTFKYHTKGTFTNFLAYSIVTSDNAAGGGRLGIRGRDYMGSGHGSIKRAKKPSPWGIWRRRLEGLGTAKLKERELTTLAASRGTERTWNFSAREHLT